MNKQIEAFIASCKFNNSVFNDYYGQDNIQGYKQDKTRHDTARSQCKNILKRLGAISKQEFIQASRYAWSGRIELNETTDEIEYTAGQFGILEMPQAMAEVLKVIELNRENN